MMYEVEPLKTMAISISFSAHSPDVSLSHIITYLFTSGPEIVHESRMVVGVVENTVTTGATTAEMWEQVIINIVGIIRLRCYHYLN